MKKSGIRISVKIEPDVDLEDPGYDLEYYSRFITVYLYTGGIVEIFTDLNDRIGIGRVMNLNILNYDGMSDFYKEELSNLYDGHIELYKKLSEA